MKFIPSKKLLVMLICTISMTSIWAQVDTTKNIPKVNAHGYAWKNAQFDSSAVFPKDTFKLKAAWRGIAFKGTSPYYWNGSTWIPFGSGAGGTVTSVALSMPSAFNVSGSPITGAGTFSVTGAGTTAQYIRGNGSLSTFSTDVETVGDARYSLLGHTHVFANITDGTTAVRNLLSGGSGISYNPATGVISATGVSVAWGDITGTLSNQTDLQAALDAKVPTSRTITINGTTQDLSVNRTWNVTIGNITGLADSLINKANKDGSNAYGTWGINITGNAATVTDGVYTTGSYANPSWITSLAWSKITGTPTTLSGYGITDALSTTLADGRFLVGNVSNVATAVLPTGDVTFNNAGVFTIGALKVATGMIQNSAVTLAKMADVATATVFYRKTAGTGAPEVNTLATLKTDLGLTGTNSGDQSLANTSDATSHTVTLTGGTSVQFIEGSGIALATGGTGGVGTVTIASTGGVSPANPTASVGLTAVNGSASTYMRSDAAPPIDVAISPIWTGTHTFRKAGIAGTSTDVAILENNTAATVGVQQWSPRLRLTGQGWKTNATAGSQTVDWITEVVPVQGAANPSSYMAFSSQINALGYTARAYLFSSGAMGLGSATDPGTAGVLNVSTGFRIANAATTGNYLRGNGTNFVSAGISAGDVPTLNQNTTGSAGSISGTNVITLANLVQGAANTVLANATAGTADFTAFAVGTNTVLGRVAGNIVAAQLATGQIANNAVTFAKFVQGAANTVVTNPTALTADFTTTALSANTVLGMGSTGNIAAITVGGILSFSGTVLSATEVDGSVSNELQTFASTSDATTHTVTLSNSGGSFQLAEGSNITLTTSGTGLNGIVTIASTGGGGSPGGSDRQVQWNNAGAFGANANFVYNASDELLLSTTDIGAYKLQVSGNIILGNLTNTGTATPERLSLGATVNNTSETANLKLALYDDGGASTSYGMTVSTVTQASLNYVVPATREHVFYIGTEKILHIQSTKLVFRTGKTFEFEDGTGDKIVYHSSYKNGIAAYTLYQNVPTGAKHSFRINDIENTYIDANGVVVTNRSADGTGANGMIAYNTTTNTFRGYENGVWKDLIATGGAAHNILSSTHTDATIGTVARGDLITGQGASATWTRLAKGTANQIFQSDGTDIGWVSMSGDATLSAGAITLGANVVTVAKMQQIATASFLGRVTAATGNVEVLTGTQATTLLDLFSTTTTTKGLVPGSNNVGSTFFLRADGVWAAPAGGGDMVLASVQTNSGAKTFLDATLLLRNVANTFSGKFTNTITADRTYTLQNASGTLAFLTDITGTNSGTNTGDQSLANTSDATSHTVTLTGGTSVQFIEGSGITLTTGGTGANGTVTIASTGGGYTNLTQFVDQTAWRLFYSNSLGDVVELALGASGTYLQSNGAASAPTWVTPGGSGDMILASAQTNTGVKTFLDGTMVLRNVANTFNGTFTNTNTADRIYTLQNASGTLAFTSDIPTTPGIDAVLAVGQALTTNRTVSVGVNSLTFTSASEPAVFESNTALTNSIQNNITTYHKTSGTVANGFGSKISNFLQTTSGSVLGASGFETIWTNAADATRTSEFALQLINSAAVSYVLTIGGAGQLKLNKYGVNTFTGTAAYWLAVTSTGQLIEMAAPGGAGANTALSNLAAVSINTALIPQTGIDLGAAATAFKDLYLYGSGTFATTSLKLTGTPTAARTITFPDASITVARSDAAQTFTGVQTFSSAPVISSITNTGTLTLPTVTSTVVSFKTASEASNATPTPSGDARSNDHYITALAAAATFAAPSGTPTNGNRLFIRIKDNGTAQTLAFNVIYRAGTDIALPTTTVISKTMYLGFVYNSADAKWDLIAFVNGL